ncbi:transformer-2 protein homolog alpha-like [Culex pipiens pallens]|uniref:transformer-2 protein homolog alpha-like n=1 Tax=Culex pipiens pallens TaxID=42434 RepID=UPI0019549030|nr:transformer-2 protein homolog alpha-like [Culex pipiens pallens]
MPRSWSPARESSGDPPPSRRPLHPRISPPARRRRSVVVRPESPLVTDSGPRCLGVFGMSGLTREADLREMFERYGKVNRVMIVQDPQTNVSRCFGFVYFERAVEANHARKMCNGTKLHSRELRVAFSTTARPHSPTPGFYKGDLVERNIQRRRTGREPRRRERRRRRRTPSPFEPRRRGRTRSRSPLPSRSAERRRRRSLSFERSRQRSPRQQKDDWYGHPGFRRVRSRSPYCR